MPGEWIFVVIFGAFVGMIIYGASREYPFEKCAQEIGVEACVSIQFPDPEGAWKNAYVECIKAVGFDACNSIRKSGG